MSVNRSVWSGHYPEPDESSQCLLSVPLRTCLNTMVPSRPASPYWSRQFLFSTKILYALLISLMLAICSACPQYGLDYERRPFRFKSQTRMGLSHRAFLAFPRSVHANPVATAPFRVPFSHVLSILSAQVKGLTCAVHVCCKGTTWLRWIRQIEIRFSHGQQRRRCYEFYVSSCN
jgi:hypothetical protein